MKRLLLVLIALMLFGCIFGQRKDFTITNGALNWSTDLGTFSGMPIKISEGADAAIYSPFGMKLAVLERRNEEFPKHTINGDTTYSFQDFLSKYLENGGTSPALDVYIQDQTSDIVDYYLCRTLLVLTLSDTTIIDNRNIIVTDATGVNVGTYICIQEAARAFQAQILSISGDTLKLDTPLDYNFSTSASIENRSPDLDVDGSGSPISAVLAPAPGVKWDVTRIIIVMRHSTAGADNLFGNLPSLTNGIVLRKSDGIHHTIFNAKNNGQLAERMYDVEYKPAIGTSDDATRARRSFNGQDKNGVVIRLDGDSNEKLEVLIQDNLTGLNSFRIVAQGHIVEGN